MYDGLQLNQANFDRFLGGSGGDANLTLASLTIDPPAGLNFALDINQFLEGTKGTAGEFNANDIVLFDTAITAGNGLYPLNAVSVVHHVGNNGQGGQGAVKGARNALRIASIFEWPSATDNEGPNYSPLQLVARATTHDNGRAGTMGATTVSGATVRPDATTFAATDVNDWIAITLDNGKQHVCQVTAKVGSDFTVDPGLATQATSGNALWYQAGVRGTIYPVGLQSSIENTSVNMVGNVAEYDFCVQTGGSAWINGGINAVLGGSGFPHSVPGKAADFGFGISATSGNAAGLRNAILVHPLNGAYPLDATIGTIIGSIGGVISCGIDLRNNTINDYFLISDNFSVTGTGVMTLSGTTRTWGTVTGSPEGVVTAPVGSIRTRTDGGANTCLYVKESGTGNTGWVAK